MAEQPRSAGVRKAERLAAGMDTAGIVKAARKEIDSTHRVYRKEWLHEMRADDREAAVQHFVTKYEDRLHEGDAQIIEDDDGTFVLQVRKWNVAAEWKRAELAEQYAAALVEEGSDPDAVVVVARNSRSEHKLISYGVLKVPGGTPTAVAN